MENIFKCSKCGNKDRKITFMKSKGNQTGLYCGSCGKWIKWLSKDEARVYEHQKDENEKKVMNRNNDNKITDGKENKLDEIQCATCGYIGIEDKWFNFSLHNKVKICPKCGILRFVHEKNKGYRKQYEKRT